MSTTAKTLRDFLNQLPEDVAQKVFENSSKFVPPTYLDSVQPQVKNVGMALKAAFPWMLSDEGMAYWINVHDSLPKEDQADDSDLKQIIDSLDKKQSNGIKALIGLALLAKMAQAMDLGEEDEPQGERTLDQQIEDAINNEDYELAAKLRDQKDGK